MTRIFLICLFSVWATFAEAATFYVAKTGSDGNNCTAAQNVSTPKLTILSALGCESAGDTIIVGDGTYTDASIGGSITAGTSTANRTTIRATNSRQVILAPTTSSTGGHTIVLTNKSYVALIGIKVNGAGISNPNRTPNIRLDGSTGVLLDDIESYNGQGQGVFCTGSPTGTITNSYLHHNGVTNHGHGLYLSVGCDDWKVDRNEFAFNAQFGTQLYSTPKRAQYTNNFLHDNCQATGTGVELIVAHQNHVIAGNVIWVTGSCTAGMWLNYHSPSGITVRHNSVYCAAGACEYGMKVASANVNAVLQNNLVLGFDTNIINESGSTTLTDNRTTGTASAIWTDPTNGNLTLKAGSAAIDDGTAIGGAANGAPDHGAYEAPKFSSCSVEAGATSVVRVTFTNNLRPPMLPASSVTGVTFRKNGANNAVVSSTRPTDNMYEFTVTNSYAGGDTVDVSIVPASTNLTDSALLGNASNQPFITTVTNTACTNNAAGAPSHTYTQARYELHDWRGTEAAPIILPHGFASTGAAENFANYKVPAGGKIRVRFAVVCGVANCPSSAFHPRFSTGGAYAVITDDFSSNNIKMCGAPVGDDVPQNGSATTDQLSTAGTFVAGGVVFTANDVPEVTGLNTGYKTEMEYCVALDTDASGNFDLRLYLDDGTALNTYTVTPRLVAEPAAAGGM